MQPLAMSAVQVAGAGSLLIGLGHLGFPRFFGWGADLERISPLTARIFVTLHAATTVILIGLGVLSLRYAHELSTRPGLPSAVCLALSAFWLWRLIWQVWYFRPATLEHTTGHLVAHYTLVILFGVLTAGYAAPLVAFRS